MKYYSLINNINENYNSLYGEISSSIIEIKKSKFIAYLFKISDDILAKKYIESIKKDNKDARHVVFIYSYLKDNLPVIRYSDDGEPNGTGTKAINEVLEKETITNVCIVIVRYFGGILLGVGPLSRAYLNAYKGCLLYCDKKEIYEYINNEFKISYSHYESIKSKISSYEDSEKLIAKNIIFDNSVTLSLNIYKEGYNNIIKDLKL